jgi:hypothetical protein
MGGSRFYDAGIAAQAVTGNVSHCLYEGVAQAAMSNVSHCLYEDGMGRRSRLDPPLNYLFHKNRILTLIVNKCR